MKGIVSSLLSTEKCMCRMGKHCSHLSDIKTAISKIYKLMDHFMPVNSSVYI